MGVLQIALQGREVDIRRKSLLMKDLVVDNRKECGRMDIMCLAGLFDRHLTYTHLEPETADELDRIFFVRHQIAYLIACFIHI